MSDQTPINIDAGHGGDWIKARTWPLRLDHGGPVRSVADLNELLWGRSMSVEQFKSMVIYKSNLDNPLLPWLGDL